MVLVILLFLFLDFMVDRGFWLEILWVREFFKEEVLLGVLVFLIKDV